MARRPVQPSLLEGYPDRPVGRIPPSVMGGTNADMIAAIAPLYLTGSVLDATYGEGKWWERFTPDPFTRHDLYKLDGVDFRDLPEADSSVDTVCFDPPYVVSGGHSTPRLGAGFQDRYGIGARNTGCEPSDNARQALWDLIHGGLDEACRVARDWVLVKCMEFAQGGGFHDVPTMVTNRAASAGWLKHDQLVHHTGAGPGGHNIFDTKRARRHHSYLIVLAPA